MKNRLIISLALLAAAIHCGMAGEVVHTLDLVHPGIPEAGRHPSRLIQVQDDQGNPLRYHLDTDSVVCGDGQCEIIKVRICWDVLGDYMRYELPQGGNLTKMGHIPFSPQDHAKLHAILSDSGSPLAQYPVAQISAPADGVQAVDAVTHATPLFYQNTVVSGAVYTCYTLWHWANGAAARQIRSLTEAGCSSDELLRYISEGSDKLSVFGMEQLARRGNYERKSVDAVIARAERGAAQQAEAAAGYLESSLGKPDNGIYFSAMERLFAAADTPKRTLYLRSLTGVKAEPPAGFFDRLAGWLPRLDSYFEVHLLLTLLERRAPCSDESVRQALLVLDNNNFLIARRAFWYLEKHPLTSVQKGRVDDFRTRFEHRL